MDAPTAVEVQEWTKLADLKAASAEEADRVVAAANGLFTRLTGLEFTAVSASQEPLVEMAVRGLSESIYLDGTAEKLETLSDFDLIVSFSAGAYSETRRNPTDAIKARMIHAWPWLNSLLWALVTPDRADEWLAFFGEIVPAFSVSEVEWGDPASATYGWGDYPPPMWGRGA